MALGFDSTSGSDGFHMASGSAGGRGQGPPSIGLHLYHLSGPPRSLHLPLFRGVLQASQR